MICLYESQLSPNCQGFSEVEGSISEGGRVVEPSVFLVGNYCQPSKSKTLSLDRIEESGLRLLLALTPLLLKRSRLVKRSKYGVL